jgi:hypothetical protein
MMTFLVMLVTPSGSMLIRLCTMPYVFLKYGRVVLFQTSYMML